MSRRGPHYLDLSVMDAALARMEKFAAIAHATMCYAHSNPDVDADHRVRATKEWREADLRVRSLRQLILSNGHTRMETA